jgi:hypothetical protein
MQIENDIKHLETNTTNPGTCFVAYSGLALEWVEQKRLNEFFYTVCHTVITASM